MCIRENDCIICQKHIIECYAITKKYKWDVFAHRPLERSLHDDVWEKLGFHMDSM